MAGGRLELEMVEGEAGPLVGSKPGSPGSRRAIDRIVEFIHEHSR